MTTAWSSLYVDDAIAQEKVRTMRRLSDGMWQGLVHGQWLAHERQMQLLELVREIQSKKIVEARAAAARDRLALEAERAGCKARRTAGSPLVRLLRIFGHAS